MNENYIATINRIIKTIEKIDAMRDGALSELMEIARRAETDCTRKCASYLSVAKEELGDFYFEEAVTALEKALKC
jgi:hypothetical protein